MRDDRLGHSTRSRQPADQQRLRHTDAETSRDELVPHEPLYSAERAPGLENDCLLLFFTDGADAKKLPFDPHVEGLVTRRRAVRKEQSDRLRQVANGVVRLLEQPVVYTRFFHRPVCESPHRNEPLWTAAAQEIDRPCRITRICAREVAAHRFDLLGRTGGGVDFREELRESLHSGIASPAATTSSSVSPSHLLARVSASSPCSRRARTTVSRYPCVTSTRPAPVACIAFISAGQST